MHIIPGVLTGSLETAQQQLDQLQGMEEVDTVQFDIIDGIFADDVTITPEDISHLDCGELQIDLHLMTDEPLDYVYETETFKEDLPIRAVIGQVEKLSHQIDFVQTVKAHGWQVGLSLDLFTPLEAVEARIWPHLDIVQLMAVEAGEQEQVFQQKVLYKIETLLQMLSAHQSEAVIMVDGGVKLENIQPLSKVGVDEVVVGSAIWTTEDVYTVQEAIEVLDQEVNL